MSAQLWVINGPNLDRLGKREPEIYGSSTLADLENLLVNEGKKLGVDVHTFQSNHEGALIEAIHKAGDSGAMGLILNPGASTHTSIALRDALTSTTLTTIEVHLSNIHAREAFRRHSYVSDVVKAIIAGLGFEGYLAAMHSLVNLSKSH